MTPQPSPMRDRRRFSRAQPNLVVEGVDLSSGMTVRLRDFSAESFAIESPGSIPDKTIREFEFPLGLGKIAFKGMPVRNEYIGTVDGQPRYLVAFEFIWKTPMGRLLVEHFVRTLKGEVA